MSIHVQVLCYHIFNSLCTDLGVELLLHAKLFCKSGDFILHSHQQCIKVPVFPYPLPHLLLSVFLILVILVGV